MNTPVIHPGPRYEALLQLLRTAEALWESSRVFFARWNLSPSQFNILNILNSPSFAPEGISQIELSRALIMHRSNVTGLVDRLEKRGLVARRANATDRRAYRVVLTAAGEQLLAEILPHYHAAAEQVWGGLPVERAHQLAAELGMVAGNASQIAGLSVDSAPAPSAPAKRTPLKKARRAAEHRKPRTKREESGAQSKSLKPAAAPSPAPAGEAEDFPVTLL